MSLRNQVPERFATYYDPIHGINLRASEEDLRSDEQVAEARLMQNCIYDGGVRIRTGSARITSTALQASKRIRGGHKFYYGGPNPTQKRLVAYGTKISHIADNGTETVLTSGMTDDLDTFFGTWSITDKAYISNRTDTLRSYDGTTFATVAGTNIPAPRTAVVPVLDRLLCITANGIERTSPRVDTTWSSNSSWATFRPQRPGLFTALHPFTVRGTDTLYPGALAFQANGYYVITGTNYGSDASAGSASAGEDSAIRLLDPNIGTSSPYSVTTVPGVGIFWFTSDKNVYFLPEGSLVGGYVGDKLISHNSTPGIESINTAAINQIWMTYFDRYLMLGIPTGSNTFCDTQFWMDMRTFNPQQPVWNGPMTGQTISRCWPEVQNGEFKVVSGEGNPATGAFVYENRKALRFQDAVGINDNNITMIYQTPFSAYGNPTRKKYVRAINYDLQISTGSPTCSIYDLDGAVATNLAIEAI